MGRSKGPIKNFLHKESQLNERDAPSHKPGRLYANYLIMLTRGENLCKLTMNSWLRREKAAKCTSAPMIIIYVHSVTY